ncbi:MAG TPA: hypothetical protein VLM11_01635 [Streptosporangiaceae bacterium]|nr:hypothetical protein [Streptosporangiaceae bacterium]
MNWIRTALLRATPMAWLRWRCGRAATRLARVGEQLARVERAGIHDANSKG